MVRPPQINHKWPVELTKRLPKKYETGGLSRLPRVYKKQVLEKHSRPQAAVHYQPDDRKFCKNNWGEKTRVQNIPIPCIYPEEADEGLWGGEGIVWGWRQKASLKPRILKLWRPKLIKRILYSEILDKWMSITVTLRTLDLIDENYGFDFYILKTHAVDLKSQLGQDLKREMLLALARKSLYPDNPEKREKIYNKYKEFIIPEEEAEWHGLSERDALRKQRQIDEEEKVRNIIPLKERYTRDLVHKLQDMSLQEGGAASSGAQAWLSKLNPFGGESEKKSS